MWRVQWTTHKFIKLLGKQILTRTVAMAILCARVMGNLWDREKPKFSSSLYLTSIMHSWATGKVYIYLTIEAPRGDLIFRWIPSHMYLTIYYVFIVISATHSILIEIFVCQCFVRLSLALRNAWLWRQKGNSWSSMFRCFTDSASKSRWGLWWKLSPHHRDGDKL